jgi:hypothetical protein
VVAHSAAAKPFLNVLFQNSVALERMVPATVDDAHATAALLKTGPDESFEATSGLGDAQSMKVQMGLDGEMTLTQTIQETPTLRVRRSLDVLSTQTQIDRLLALYKFNKKAQTLILTSPWVRNFDGPRPR